MDEKMRLGKVNYQIPCREQLGLDHYLVEANHGSQAYTKLCSD